MRDLKSNINAITLHASADNTSTEVNSYAMDLQGFNAACILVEVGTITVSGAGAVLPVLQESADNSTWTAVTASEVIGAFTVLVTDTNQKISYNGIKRYIRVHCGVTATVSAATYGILGVHADTLTAAVAAFSAPVT